MALNAAGLDWMVLMSWIMWLMHARAYKTDHQSRLLLEAASMMVETRCSTFFFLYRANESILQYCHYQPKVKKNKMKSCLFCLILLRNNNFIHHIGACHEVKLDLVKDILPLLTVNELTMKYVLSIIPKAPNRLDLDTN